MSSIVRIVILHKIGTAEQSEIESPSMIDGLSPYTGILYRIKHLITNTKYVFQWFSKSMVQFDLQLDYFLLSSNTLKRVLCWYRSIHFVMCIVVFI